MAGRAGETLVLYSDRASGTYGRWFTSEGVAEDSYSYVDQSMISQIISKANTAFEKSYTELTFEMSPYGVGEAIPDWAAFTQI